MNQTETLVALGPLVYAGQHLATGQAFQASPRDARLLKAVGRAAAAPEPCAEAAPAPAAQETAGEEKPRRAYKRRDMAAEG